MLDLDPTRAAVPPREAATLLLVRDLVSPSGPAIEIFCVVRHTKSAFLGGAVVFPGGKVDPADRDAAWVAHTNAPPCFVAGEDEAIARAYAIAVCREALEEAAILLTSGAPLTHDDVVALRASLTKDPASFRDALYARALSLDLAALHPFGRWITPEAESRRFDTRFFLAAAPKGQHGAHDAHETTASFWATPREVLRRFVAREVELAPPTHRCLELLADAKSSAEAIEIAASLGVEPICPKLVTVAETNAETLALTLPGDPEHDVQVLRVPGQSRFVLRDGQWLPEPAPI